jgi:hypothetical protein
MRAPLWRGYLEEVGGDFVSINHVRRHDPQHLTYTYSGRSLHNWEAGPERDAIPDLHRRERAASE